MTLTFSEPFNTPVPGPNALLGITRRVNIFEGEQKVGQLRTHQGNWEPDRLTYRKTGVWVSTPELENAKQAFIDSWSKTHV